MAFHFDHGGFVSHVAEVTADGANVRVDKVYAGIVITSYSIHYTKLYEWWQAQSALDDIAVEWDFGPHAGASSAAFDAVLTQGLSADDAKIGNTQGDAAGALAAADRVVEAVYDYPHQNHAPMVV